jgi:hypothetical protein
MPHRAKKYNLQKGSDMGQLLDFVQHMRPWATPANITPQDVMDFVTFRMQMPGRGRTTVHRVDCSQLRAEHPTCGCPTYCKHNSTVQLTKHLRTELSKLVSKQPWEKATQSGNPVCSRQWV